VRADCTVKGSDVWFVVEDDGPGVPVSDRRRIFEPFVTNRQKGGTGLGLAIVATIANEHGGSVAVSESALGGARFALVLPRVSTPKNPRPPPQVFPEVSPSAR
jgi:signal transduction histidine kinase